MKTARAVGDRQHRSHLRRATAVPAPARARTAASNLHQGRTRSLELVIGITGKESLTADAVARVRLMAAVSGAIRQPL